MMLFTDASVFDGACLLPNETVVLVKGQKIESIGHEREYRDYTGLRQSILGATILPGLIDCHAHLVLSGDMDVWTPLITKPHATLALKALESAQACLRGGVTSLRDCGGVDHIELSVRDACNAGRALGPTIRAAGQFICMCGGANHLVARVANGASEIRVAVREQVRAGCDFVKLMATGSVLTPGLSVDDVQYDPTELEAGVAEAKRLNRYAAVHAIGTTGILNAVRAGARSIEHGMFLTNECIDEMLCRGTYLVPTLGAVSRLLAHKESVPEEVFDKAAKVAERHKASVRNFFLAGGLIAMGGDTGTPFNPHGENALELEEMVQAGLPPLEALISATSKAADLMGLHDRGRLQAGNYADLLIVSGNPIADIRMASRTENHLMVMKNGSAVIRTPKWGTQSHISTAVSTV